MPWSESRQPTEWKKSCRCRRASRKRSKSSPTSMPLRCGQPVDPGVERRGRFHGHRLVGPKRRQHPDRKRRIGRDRPVMLQRVGRIVGRADQHDVHLPHDAAGGELGPGELRVALVPDALGRVGTQQPVADAQRPLQFQVRPVVQRVAERLRHGLGPFLELLPIRGVAGADSVPARRPPASPAICNDRRAARSASGSRSGDPRRSRPAEDGSDSR